jgi:CRP-like cAMP-binding protein
LAVASNVEEDRTARAGIPGLMCKSMLPALSSLKAQAILVRARGGQDLGLTFDGGEALFVVASGVLTLHVTMPGTPRQVVALLFPGDVMRSSLAPPQGQATMSSAMGAERWRRRWTAFEALAAAEPAIARYFRDALTAQMARSAIHLVAIGQFSGEQRVATLLIELALRAGLSVSGGAMTIEMPFSRKDIADYLGLNPIRCRGPCRA